MGDAQTMANSVAPGDVTWKETPSTAGPSEGSTKPPTVPPVVSPDAPATPETSMGETGKGQSSEARADEHAKLPMFSVYPTTLGGKEKFAVKEFENKGFGDSLFDTEAEATKQAEIAKRQSDDKIARQEKAKADEEATVKKQQEYEGSFQGFLSDTPMVKGRQLSTLGKQRSYQGKVVTVKELIEQKVADGAIVNDDGQLESADGAYLGSDKITKIGIDYARHLIASKPVPAVDAESQGTAESPTDADIDRAIGNFKKRREDYIEYKRELLLAKQKKVIEHFTCYNCLFDLTPGVKKRHFWFFGEFSTGKSTEVYKNNFKDKVLSYKVRAPHGDSYWGCFDGYKQEKYVVFDDSESKLSKGLICSLAAVEDSEVGETPVACRYKDVVWFNEVILIVLSNQVPGYHYQEDWREEGWFRARFMCVEVVKGEEGVGKIGKKSASLST